MEQWLIEIQPESFEPEVLKCSKPALVTFLKKGVASGDMLIAVLKRFAHESKSGVAFFKIDVEQCSEIAARYRISKIPMTLVFIKGKVAAHFFGVVSAQKVKNTIEAALR